MLSNKRVIADSYFPTPPECINRALGKTSQPTQSTQSTHSRKLETNTYQNTHAERTHIYQLHFHLHVSSSLNTEAISNIL